MVTKQAVSIRPIKNVKVLYKNMSSYYNSPDMHKKNHAFISAPHPLQSPKY